MGIFETNVGKLSKSNTNYAITVPAVWSWIGPLHSWSHTMDDGSTKTYTVTVYVDKGSLADQFWDKLTDFYNQTPWWQYAKHQQSTKKYPKYW